MQVKENLKLYSFLIKEQAINHMTGKKNFFVTLDSSVKRSFGDNTKVAIEESQKDPCAIHCIEFGTAFVWRKDTR